MFSKLNIDWRFREYYPNRYILYFLSLRRKIGHSVATSGLLPPSCELTVIDLAQSISDYRNPPKSSSNTRKPRGKTTSG